MEFPAPLLVRIVNFCLLVLMQPAVTVWLTQWQVAQFDPDGLTLATKVLLMFALSLPALAILLFDWSRRWVADEHGVTRLGPGRRFWPWSDIRSVEVSRQMGMHPMVSAMTVDGRRLRLTIIPFWYTSGGTRTRQLVELAAQAEKLRTASKG